MDHEQAVAHVQYGLRYDKLARPAEQIRLLKLVEEEDDAWQKQLRFSLTTFARSDAPNYVAISYTWGDSKHRCTITVDSATVRVTENCWYALSQMKLHRAGHYLWIDALCIDQSDRYGEKASQVASMGDTYWGAESVAACIGPSSAELDGLMEAINARAGLRDASILEREQLPGAYDVLLNGG